MRTEPLRKPISEMSHVLTHDGRTRYNSLDSNAVDLEMCNRLLHSDRVQQLTDPCQLYVNAPYRVGDATQPFIGQQTIHYPNNYYNNDYDRQNSNLCSSRSSIYSSSNGTPGIMPPTYHESEINGIHIGSTYDKYTTMINCDQSFHDIPYSQIIYPYNQAVSRSPPLAHYQQQYSFPLMSNHQNVPQYGKTVNRFHKKKINQCKICGKVLTRPSSLHSHMFVHTGDRPYECKWLNCGKTFNVKSNMNRHYKLHLRRHIVDGRLKIKEDGKKLFEVG